MKRHFGFDFAKEKYILIHIYFFKLIMIECRPKGPFFLLVLCALSLVFSAHGQQTHRYTLSGNQPDQLVADAGEDIYAVPGETFTLGGQAVAKGGIPPYQFLWEPATGLDDPAYPFPKVQTGNADITYAITVTDARGCTATDEVSIIIDVTTSIESGDAETPVVIYPNPAQSWIIIKVATSDGNLSLYNNYGKLVWQGPVNSPEHVLDIRTLAKGIYLLTLQDRDSTHTFRLVVQ